MLPCHRHHRWLSPSWCDPEDEASCHACAPTHPCHLTPFLHQTWGIIITIFIITLKLSYNNTPKTLPAALLAGADLCAGGNLNSAPVHPSQRRRARRARRRASGMMQFLPFTLYLYFLSCTIYISHRRRWSAAPQSIIKWLGAKDAYK